MTQAEAREANLINERNTPSKEQEGYKVVYEDGFTSWSPKTAFEKGYTEAESEGEPFGRAVLFMKQGYKVAREGWSEQDTFIYYVAANKYPMSNNLMETMAGRYEDDLVPYQAYIAIKAADDTVVPWVPSQSDVLAEDWKIVQ